MLVYTETSASISILGGKLMTDPVFFAATYNNQTFECLDLPVGTGPATYTTPAGLLLPGHDGVYVALGAGDAPWHGARWDGGTPYADDGAGVLLDPLPSLYAAPALTNEFPWSTDRTNAFFTNTATVTMDQTGIDGTPNTGALIDDTSAAATQYSTRRFTGVPDDSNPLVVRYFIAKDSDQTRFPEFFCSLIFGTGVNIRPRVDTSNGDTHIQSSAGVVAIEVNDSDPWWEVLCQLDNNGTGNTAIDVYIYPAINDALIGASDVTTTGSVIHGHTDVFFNKTIAEVRGSAPIITAGAGATTAQIDINWPAANYPLRTNIAAYAEFQSPSGTSGGSSPGWYRQTSSGQHILRATPLAPIVARYINTGDASVSVSSGAQSLNAEIIRAAMAAHDASNDIVVKGDGVVEGTATDFKNVAAATPNIRLYRSTGHIDSITLTRNLRLYTDFADFAEADALIDALLAGSDTGFPFVVPAGPSTQVNDQYRAFLNARGFTTGNYNDDMFAFLGSLGYTGALSDRLNAWWAAGAPLT
jgi:hypothetical protein